MLSDTLEKGLRHYAIGPKIRALRLRKKMGLVELGQHSGLSAAMLSKIERERLVPTLPTLFRIALVFSVGLEHFFSDPAERPALAVVRRRDRQRFPDKPDQPHVNYWFECLDYPAVDRKLHSFYVEFEDAAGEHLRRHDHAGAEVLYVLQGSVAVSIGDVTHELDAGDSVYFDSSVPHAYARRGPAPAAAIVVTTS